MPMKRIKRLKRSKRATASETKSDMISYMPEDILHRIVSRLPVKQAVSTCILSRKWRYIWRFIDTMVFDEEKDFNTSNVRFKSFINQTLDLHKSYINLEKFCIRMKSSASTGIILNFNQLIDKAFSQIPEDDIVRWTNSAVTRNVKDFDLTCSTGLPSCLFGARSITSLRLSRVKIGEFDGDANLDSLNSISLQNVSVSTETMGRVLSGSPVLENIYLEECEVLSSLEGRHTGLRSIQIEFCNDLVKFDMDVPNLQTFKCRISENQDLEIQRLGAKSLRSIEVLLLEETLIRDSCLLMPTISYRIFELLKTLNLTKFRIKDEILQFMIHNCPLLEDLIMVKCITPSYVSIFSDSLKSLGLYDCSNLEGFKIDAPNLVVFNYSGGMVHVSLMNSTCKLEAQINLTMKGMLFDISRSALSTAQPWSRKLKKVLAMFNHAKTLKLNLANSMADNLMDLVDLPNQLEVISNELHVLLHGIVSLLPTREAISTCVLSKRWRYIWRYIHTLDFSQYNIGDNERFKYFINQTILLHKSRVNLKNIRIHFLHLAKIPYELDQWINSALNRKVQEFDLRCPGHENYLLPSSVYSAHSISSLMLENCIVQDTNGSMNLVSLETLSLHEVVITNQMIEQVVINCPLLKGLWIERCKGLLSLEGRHNGIRSITISYYCNFKEFNMDVPNLQSFECIGCQEVIEIKTCGLRSLCSIESMSFGSGNMSSCLPGIFRPSNFMVFRALKTLKLQYFSITNEVLHSLISNCPLLEDLEMFDCTTQRDLKISCQILKRLAVTCCSELQGIKIDVPNLEYFEYDGEIVDVSSELSLQYSS
ncbi:hypothetical protein GIB67_014156 [Kingdonia uniflora]|uniref:F-box domain-containing protein n=1 Tax=Kingdonia uniflora TaxID=39325 RepID=A0A7J7N4F6_9MAGN|nr:hypothetical protein GIB67_014156 [Kingdonia uniflora]